MPQLPCARVPTGENRGSDSEDMLNCTRRCAFKAVRDITSGMRLKMLAQKPRTTR